MGHLGISIMKNITNIDEIIIRYYKACIGLDEIIKEIAKGDWSKAELIYTNNEQFRNLTEERLNSLKDFEHAWPGGNIHASSPDLVPFYNKLVQIQTTSKKDSFDKCAIAFFLEHIRDEWEDKIKYGDIPDNGIVETFDAFFRLPNYDPDSWLKRKFDLRGVYISSFKVRNIPESVIQGVNESCSSYIYGNYLATVAMARSVLEFSLKHKFPKFCNYTLHQITTNIWDSEPLLKNKENYRKQANYIRMKGNDVLHEGDIKILELVNEMTARSVLNQLKDLIEFIYT